jgi:CubicO group peptidase (beta-lactamase class C family)
MSFIFNVFLVLQFYILISSFSFDKINKTELENVIKVQMERARMPTLGIIITDKNKTLYQNIFGKNTKANIQTPFILGSVSKSFSALAILKSNVSLNDTLDKYDLKDYIKKELAKNITISELLNHTSGLNSFSSDRSSERGKFSYSNYGFSLLGKVIEKKKGMKYSEFMDKNIFKPLNMVNTKAEYSESIIESYYFVFNSKTKNTNLKSEMTGKNEFQIPAGYISSSIEDMGNYLRFFLDKKNAEYISNMTICSVNTSKKNYEYYGMGMSIVKRNDNIIYHHSGNTPSFSSQLSIYPKLDLGIFMVSNINDLLSPIPFSQFYSAVQNFLINGVYDDVDIEISFFRHFFFNVLCLLFMAIPIVYLVITIIRKCKRKKYTWFINIKGKIIFGVEVFILFILPIIISIGFRSNEANLFVKDFVFTVNTMCITLWLTLIIKIVYIILYNKLNWEVNENEKKDELKELVSKEDDIE